MKNIFFAFCFLLFASYAYAQTVISADGWYRIASSSATETDANITITDDSQSGSNDLVFYAAFTHNAVQDVRRTAYIKGTQFYANSIFKKLRYIRQNKSQPIYLEIYIETGGSNKTVSSSFAAGNKTQLSSVAFTAGSVPSGYDDVEMIIEGLEFSDNVYNPVSVADLDNDPSNELQTLAIAGNQLSISGGNIVALPEITIPSFTQGSVVFADSNGNLSEDNTNLKWTGNGLEIGENLSNINASLNVSSDLPNWGDLMILQSDTDPKRSTLKFRKSGDGGVYVESETKQYGLHLVQEYTDEISDLLSYNGVSASTQDAGIMFSVRKNTGTGNQKILNRTAFIVANLTTPLFAIEADGLTQFPFYNTAVNNNNPNNIAWFSSNGTFQRSTLDKIDATQLDFSNAVLYADNAAAFAALGAGKIYRDANYNLKISYDPNSQ